MKWKTKHNQNQKSQKNKNKQPTKKTHTKQVYQMKGTVCFSGTWQIKNKLHKQNKAVKSNGK